MLEDVAAPLSRTMSLAIELVGIAVIAIGMATTLALFVFNLAKGSGFDEAIRMLSKTRPSALAAGSHARSGSGRLPKLTISVAAPAPDGYWTLRPGALCACRTGA